MCMFVLTCISLVVLHIVNRKDTSASALLCVQSQHDHSRWKLLFFAMLDVSLCSFFFILSYLQVCSVPWYCKTYLHSQPGWIPQEPTVVQRVALTETSDALCGEPIPALLSFGSVCLLLFPWLQSLLSLTQTHTHPHQQFSFIVNC